MNDDKEHKLVHIDEDEEDEEDEGEIGTPIASLLFDFLVDPHSSNYAAAWSIFTIILVMARVLAMCLESVNGPNEYYGRPEDLSQFPFLLTKPQYWKVYIATMVPLIMDGFGRIVFLLLIMWESENHPIYERFRGDPMEVFLFCTDVLGLIPFFADAVYYEPKNASQSQAAQVFLSALELLLTGRILRAVRKYPAIQAITRALSRSVEHLILPLFFFFVFNITTGVFFYFSTPCYNLETCPWKNLFDASFYSIVTMTTTGYGNQIPMFEFSRFVACCVMIFGSLFLSMPLAIIGNEYDRAWNEIKDETRAAEEVQKEQAKATERRKSQSVVAVVEDGSKKRQFNDPSVPLAVISEEPPKELTLEEKKQLVRHQPVMSTLDHIHRILQKLHDDHTQHRHHIPHSTVLHLCELKAWLPTLIMNIDQTIAVISTISSQSFLTNMTEMVVESITQQQGSTPSAAAAAAAPPARRFSVVGGGAGLPVRPGVVSVNTNDILQKLQAMKKNSVAPDPVAQMHGRAGGNQAPRGKALPTITAAADSDSENDDSDDDNDNDENSSHMSFSIDEPVNPQALAPLRPSDILQQSNYDEDSDDYSLSTISDDEQNTFSQSNSNHSAKSYHPVQSPRTSYNHGSSRPILPSMVSAGRSVSPRDSKVEMRRASREAMEAKDSSQGSESTESDEEERGEEGRGKDESALMPPINNRALSKGDVDIPPGDRRSSKSRQQKQQQLEQRKSSLDHRKKSETIAAEGTVAAEPIDESASQPAPMLGQISRASRQSMYVRLLKVIGVEDTAARQRTVTDDFVDRMAQVSRDPNSLRSRIWIMLELPSSSREARALQLLLIFLISLSIFSLYTQTVTRFTRYGENTFICQELVEVYCGDKHNPHLDPACFVQSSWTQSTATPLRFYCDESDCFGHGYNFAAFNSSMTCTNAHRPPFQAMDSLLYRYGTPTMLFSRIKMHRSNPVCSRIECIDNSESFFDAHDWWIAVEFIINGIFTVELILRLIVAESVLVYWKDKMNLFDFLSIFPFYSELFSAVVSNRGFSSIDFSILASSPESMFLVYVRALKVFRLFKLTRHFRASKVLIETARRVFLQIVGMLVFMAFIVLLFAIVLYELEKGESCYVGDPGCVVPEMIQDIVHPGQIIFVNKMGFPSSFQNVFFGVWFSFVTLTTVGYGDIVPVTDGGLCIAIFLMIAGQFYMAMPLTAAATTFYVVHEQYSEDNHQHQQQQIADDKQDNANNNNEDNKGLTVSRAPVLDDRLQLSLRFFTRAVRAQEHSLFTVVQEIQDAPFSIFDLETLQQHHKQQQQEQAQRLSQSQSQTQSLSLHTKKEEDSHTAASMRVVVLRKHIAQLRQEMSEMLHNGERDVIDLLMRYRDLLQGHQQQKSSR